MPSRNPYQPFDTGSLFPAVIVKVEEYGKDGNVVRAYHEVRINGEVVGHAETYDMAVRVAEDAKHWAARPRVVSQASLADEIAA